MDKSPKTYEEWDRIARNESSIISLIASLVLGVIGAAFFIYVTIADKLPTVPGRIGSIGLFLIPSATALVMGLDERGVRFANRCMKSNAFRVLILSLFVINAVMLAVASIATKN